MLTAKEFFQLANTINCLQSYNISGGNYVQSASVIHILSQFAEGVHVETKSDGLTTRYMYQPIDNGLPSTDLMDMTVFADRMRTYASLSTAEKKVVHNMCRILNDQNADEQERDMACSTILEALHELDGDGKPLNDLGEPTC